MHLADYPTLVEGQPTRRVPILITGNDFSRLYGPLCRPGRMALFNWILTTQEREAVMARLLNGLSRTDIALLSAEFGNQSLASWAAVAIQLQDNALGAFYSEYGLAHALQLTLRGEGPSASLVTPCLEGVRATAHEVLSNDAANHLESVQEK